MTEKLTPRTGSYQQRKIGVEVVWLEGGGKRPRPGTVREEKIRSLSRVEKIREGWSGRQAGWGGGGLPHKGQRGAANSLVNTGEGGNK